MRICAEVCQKDNKCCNQKDCRMWIDYNEDFNCAEIAIMTLKQVGSRLAISYVRVSQIEKEALNKLQKNSFNK